MQLDISRMAVVITRLRLMDAHLGQFGVGIDGLIAAGTKQDLGLGGDALFEQESEADRRTILQGNQARDGPGGGVEVRGVAEGRRLGTVGDATLRVRSVIVDGDAQLAQIRKAGGFAGLGLGAGHGREEHRR